MSDVRLVKFDNHMKQSFLDCPQFYYWRHELGLRLEKARRAYPLEFGLGLHAGLEEWYGQVKSGEEPDVDRVLKAFLGEFAEDQPAPILKSGKEGDALYTRVRGCYLLQEYVEKYREQDRDGFEVLEVEIGFAEELVEGVVYCGRIDLACGFKDGVRGMDHKSTSRMDRFSMSPNNQFMGYQWGLGKFYQECAGMIGNLVGVYKSKPMEECFDRQFEKYNDEQMREWKRETVLVANQIRACRELGVWPKNTNHCGAYAGICGFRPLCTAVNQSARDSLVETMYVVDFWEPYPHVEG